MAKGRPKSLPPSKIVELARWMEEKYERVDDDADGKPLFRAHERRSEADLLDEFLISKPEFPKISLTTYRSLRLDCIGRLYTRPRSAPPGDPDVVTLANKIDRVDQQTNEAIAALEQRLLYIEKVTLTGAEPLK